MRTRFRYAPFRTIRLGVAGPTFKRMFVGLVVGACVALLAPTALQAAEGPDTGCLTCHTDAGFLMGTVRPAEAPPEDGCAAAPTRPPFVGAFVNPAFPDTLHGRIGCTNCHGGNDAATDMAGAHAGLRPGIESCTACHADIVERHETSLHHTLRGMELALLNRAGEANYHDHLQPVWDADCNTCHTECSDCHVSLPEAVGGGLIRGHEFFRRAPMEDTCALCHGSRAGGEYLGSFEGIPPDAHFEAGMHCLDCHRNDLHGDGTSYDDRWEVAGRAQCSDCHATLPNTKSVMHTADHEAVACQVCHGQPYQNCFDCHAGEEDGAYFRHAGSKSLQFKIGRNTVEGYPHDIVTLRSNPVARHSFNFFGNDLLPDFDGTPTWKTAAPHNIRRSTPQNQTCATCHDDPSLFLAEGELDPDGAAANVEVLLGTGEETARQGDRQGDRP